MAPIINQVRPLDDFNELVNIDIDLELPSAKICQISSKSDNRFSISRQKNLQIKLTKATKSPKTLVCHDMNGGYHEDKYTHGCDHILVEPYTFLHWSKIDAFIYFSHHFITIPPLGWIDSGHRNGVQVLGTIITEFESGTKICDEILANEGIFFEPNFYFYFIFTILKLNFLF
jgi:hypothetical protein